MNELNVQLSRIESKLDRYSERITRVEERIKGLQGFTKIIVAILLAAGSFFARSYLAN